MQYLVLERESCLMHRVSTVVTHNVYLDLRTEEQRAVQREGDGEVCRPVYLGHPVCCMARVLLQSVRPLLAPAAHNQHYSLRRLVRL